MSETVTAATADAPLGAPVPLLDAATLIEAAAADTTDETNEKDQANVLLVTKGDSGNYTVTDPSGRKLVVRKLSQAERARMLEAAEEVASYGWIGMAATALSVRSLNSVPLPFPATKKEIENRFTQLGDDGMEAAQNVLALAREGKVLNRYEMVGENPVIAKN